MKHKYRNWHRDYHTSIFAQYPIVVDGEGKEVAAISYGGTCETATAVCDFICSAPDMYLAIKELLSAMGDPYDSKEFINAKNKAIKLIHKIEKGE